MDNESGYHLFSVDREPGLEIQRDDEDGRFKDDDEARLQFVLDLERGERAAKRIARQLLGRPHWGYDIDNETMFYTSKVCWDFYNRDNSNFADDDREARRVALIAAELFEQHFTFVDWDKEDYTDYIWKYVHDLERLFDTMTSDDYYPGMIKNEDHLRELLYKVQAEVREREPTLKERARAVLQRFNDGEDLTGPDDLAGALIKLLEDVVTGDG